ncbi:hypothetical protein [Campylobacter helveticus]|uniref:hypothetical protein n=1 Tax=Campylobacter helveticus TaxID=28898 RepID=UPI00214A74FA|nr:hypothetical protein [Campylobacter helveticus]MCR2062404.1 hypothetical protein [Campylobacter helveticus]
MNQPTIALIATIKRFINYCSYQVETLVGGGGGRKLCPLNFQFFFLLKTLLKFSNLKAYKEENLF